MRQYLTAGAVGSLALVLAPVVVPAQATARVSVASSVAMGEVRAVPPVTTTTGTVVSFRQGKLRVSSRGKKLDFVVARITTCGVVRSGRGSALRCADLGQKQYRSERVRVRWSRDVKKRRVAGIIILTIK